MTKIINMIDPLKQKQGDKLIAFFRISVDQLSKAVLKLNETKNIKVKGKFATFLLALLGDLAIILSIAIAVFIIAWTVFMLLCITLKSIFDFTIETIKNKCINISYSLKRNPYLHDKKKANAEK